MVSTPVCGEATILAVTCGLVEEPTPYLHIRWQSLPYKSTTRWLGFCGLYDNMTIRVLSYIP